MIVLSLINNCLSNIENDIYIYIYISKLPRNVIVRLSYRCVKVYITITKMIKIHILHI